MKKIIPPLLWKEIAKELPVKKSKVGRPSEDPEKMLNGIMFVIITGIQWHMLPECYGKPSTVHGWLRRLKKKIFFKKLLKKSAQLAVKYLGNTDCFYLDTSSCKAPLANYSGKNPTDRSKRGVKKILVINYKRIIFSISSAAANIHDKKLLTEEQVKILRQFARKKRKFLMTDSAWDCKEHRTNLHQHNISLISSTNRRRNKNRKKYYSPGRWRIEQVLGILNWKRGIKLCWNKSRFYFDIFLQFAAALHNFKLAGIFV